MRWLASCMMGQSFQRATLGFRPMKMILASGRSGRILATKALKSDSTLVPWKYFTVNSGFVIACQILSAGALMKTW